jgi:hypothetical protein
VKKFYLIIAFLLISISAHAGWITLRDTSLNEIGTADNPLKVRLADGESLQWSEGASDAIYYNDGNVGIGTSDPSVKLEVLSASTGAYVTITKFLASNNTGTNTSNQLVFGVSGSVRNSAEWRFIHVSNGSTSNRLDFGFNGVATPVFSYNANSNIGIGITAPSAKLHTISTTEQLRLGYDTSNYVSTTVGSTGAVTLNAVGSGSSFIFNDSMSFPYRAITALRTLDSTDYTVDCTANSFTVTLPSAIDIQGRIYNIKNTGTGVITVATTSSQTIDGKNSETIKLNNKYNLKVQSNGSDWIILENIKIYQQ